jgi:hypothetical protein
VKPKPRETKFSSRIAKPGVNAGTCSVTFAGTGAGPASNLSVASTVQMRVSSSGSSG